MKKAISQTFVVNTKSEESKPKQQQKSSEGQQSGNHSKVVSTFQFTSESVSAGHPDKLCDQISDAILDAHLRRDRAAKVAVEVVAKFNQIIILGEITARNALTRDEIVRLVCETLREIGYSYEYQRPICRPSLQSSTSSTVRFPPGRAVLDYQTCDVKILLSTQSAEIASGITRADLQAPQVSADFATTCDSEQQLTLGAGDQGIMFGYATDETREMMPLTAVLAHRLMHRLAELRNSGGMIPKLIGPDGKSQVTCTYGVDEHGAILPLYVSAIVISVQHSSRFSLESLRQMVSNLIIRPMIPDELIVASTKILINPAGEFTIGGPMIDTGLTGRKIIVDSYGGWGGHGGGSFSGKDPTKVDRSGAYAARWIAKSLVAAGVCHRCSVQLAYAIGVTQPIAVSVHSYGTSIYESDQNLEQIVMQNFDLRPGALIAELDLQKPIYRDTACYGHFGRGEYRWETPKKLVILPLTKMANNLISK